MGRLWGFFYLPGPFKGKALKCDIPLAEFTWGQINSSGEIKKAGKPWQLPESIVATHGHHRNASSSGSLVGVRSVCHYPWGTKESLV